MPRCSICRVQFGCYAKYLKNLLQTHKTMDPKLSNFDQKMYNTGTETLAFKLHECQFSVEGFYISPSL